MASCAADKSVNISFDRKNLYIVKELRVARRSGRFSSSEAFFCVRGATMLLCIAFTEVFVMGRMPGRPSCGGRGHQQWRREECG
jgi:hypothetical protein